MEEEEVQEQGKTESQARQKKSSRAGRDVKCPERLYDHRSGRSYERGKLLGRGGFASCFAVRTIEMDGAAMGQAQRDCEEKRQQEQVGVDRELAVKVVGKTLLRHPRMRAKLVAEIRIHRSLRHKHVVGFRSVFEDEHNVYIVLERCQSMTLAGLLRRRKRLDEMECASYLRQIIAALQYLHGVRVVHRDLKLSNILLASNDGSVKLGDFGLACRLHDDEDRKTTICGTPNYIAPEVLAGKSIGHSYEVDIWSVGVVAYTLLLGRPPFESPEVKTTYRRIRSNAYCFPENVPLSDAARDFIQSALQPDPSDRASLDELWCHPFIAEQQRRHNTTVERMETTRGDEPSAHDEMQTHRTRPAADVNVHSERRFRNAWATPREDGARVKEEKKEEGEPSLAHDRRTQQSPQERISKLRLLHVNDDIEAKSPSEDANNGHSPSARSPSFALSPIERDAESTNSGRVVEDGVTLNSNGKSARRDEHWFPSSHEIVSINPTPLEDRTNRASSRVSTMTRSAKTVAMRAPAVESTDYAVVHDVPAPSLDGPSTPNLDRETKTVSRMASPPSPVPTPLASDPASAVWITHWLDYSSKYGLGYRISNGCVGVFFNDATKIVQSADGARFEYMGKQKTTSSSSSSTVSPLGLPGDNAVRVYRGSLRDDDDTVARIPSAASSSPQDLRKKLALLRHFNDHFEKEWPSACNSDENAMRHEVSPSSTLDSPMIHVKKWIVTRLAIVFRLSNHSIQVNFNDNARLLLLSERKLVSFVDVQDRATVYSLAKLPDDRDLLQRLKYAKLILHQFVSKSSRCRSTAA